MSANRTNLVLGAALVVQLALVAIVHLAQSKPTVARLEPILGIEASSITKLEIYARVTDAKTAAADSAAEPAIVLTKSGISWTVASHHDYPAEIAKVDTFITKLVGMSAREPVATKAARHRHLAVADDKFERRVVVHLGSEPPIEIYIGAAAGRQQTAIRLKGQEKTYGATGITSSGAGTSISAWIDTTYLKLVGPMSTLEMSGAGVSFQLRKVDGSWKRHEADAEVPIPEGKEMDAGAIDAVANRLLNLQLLEPAAPELSGFAPRLTVVYAGADGAKHTLKVGDEKDAQTLITIDDKVPVWVSKGSMTSLVEMTADKLYRDPPAPGDEAAPGPGGMPPGMLPPGMLPPGMPPPEPR